MDFGADMIGIVKTNAKGLYKNTIKNLKKDFPGGSYLVLKRKSTVPGDRYKSKYQKVLSFVDTEDEGSTNDGIPCSSKYPDQFANVYILPVSHLLVVSKFFGSVNEVDPFNKSRQSDLVLGKCWVTQCGWLWLCVTVAMGMTITHFWKLFSYGVKRYQYEKLTGIRKKLEPLALDCFNNPFTTDTGTTGEYIPLLDEVDGGETVPTRRTIHFFSSTSRSTQGKTISRHILNRVSSADSILGASTIGSQHTAEKEIAKKRGRYNQTVRGYYNGRLPNGRRCLKRTLLFCNGCTKFNKKAYYCTHLGHDFFATHLDSLIHHR